MIIEWHNTRFSQTDSHIYTSMNYVNIDLDNHLKYTINYFSIFGIQGVIFTDIIFKSITSEATCKF